LTKVPASKASRPDLGERIQTIVAALKRAYPDAHCELDYSNPLELLIATILSAQCSDKQVNKVTAELFRKYRTAADYATASQTRLEEDIKSIGLYRNKARNIQAACRKLVERHAGQVPGGMEELIELDGVGRKTANVVLGNAFHSPCGVVVDTHVARLSGRLGLTRQRTPEKIERVLMKLLPRDEWTLFSHLLIWHGRRRCFARSPDCAACEISELCPRVGVLPKSKG
jgi:endonuclease-3